MMRARNTAGIGPKALAVFAAAALAAGALAFPATAGTGSESDEAAMFIRNFTDEAIVKLTDDERPASQKQADFRELLVRGFYLDGIGRFVLGRHWCTLDKDAQNEYLNAFEDYLVATYSRRMDAYSGETLDVVGARKRKRDFYVQSWLRDTRNADVRIEWRVRRMDDGNWKIVDITIEGISMVITQRSEFASVLRASGGDVTPLVEDLRAKWTAFEEAQSESLATN